MEDRSEFESGKQQQHVIDQMVEKVPEYYSGEEITHVYDQKKGFLIQERVSPENGNRHIVRIYGRPDHTGEVNTIDYFHLASNDADPHNFDLFISRSGENGKISKGGRDIHQYEDISITGSGDSVKDLIFTENAIDKGILVGYDENGNLDLVTVDRYDSKRNSYGHISVDKEKIMQIIENSEQELVQNISEPGNIKVQKDKEGLCLEIVVESPGKKDNISIPLRIDMNQILQDLGIDKILEDPRRQETDVDNRWIMTRLRNAIGMKWVQERLIDFRGMYEDRD